MENINIPSLHGNWVDLAIILVVVCYLLGSSRRGFLLGLLGLSGFLLSFFAALKLYKFFGFLLISNFSLPKGISNAAGFLIAGFLTEFAFSIFLNFFYRKIYPCVIEKIKKMKVSVFLFKVDRLMGFFPVLIESLIFIAFILTILITLPLAGVIKKDIISSKIGGGLVKRTQWAERQINSIFGEAVNETLNFITITANLSSQEKIDLGFTQKEVKVDEQAEEIMFNLVNQERIKRKLNPLKLSLPLRSLAREYASDMFSRGFFSHFNPEGLSPFDRMQNKNINFITAGENLGLAPNVILAHQGLMSSAGHRANILNPEFGKVGIGVIDGGIYGEMFVQEFTD